MSTITDPVELVLGFVALPAASVAVGRNVAQPRDPRERRGGADEPPDVDLG
jgi:hypothetical protein